MKPSLLIVILLASLFGEVSAREKIIEQARSLYRNVLVVQDDHRLCLRFTLKKQAQNQSCRWLNKPDQLVFDYTKMMATAMATLPHHPKKVLMIGLGGGTLVTVLNRFYPSAAIDVVEIDPVVVSMAKRYFGFAESDHIKVHTQDGRVFVKRARLAKNKYDLVILDAFNGDYIPPHLMTKEFLAEVKDILQPNGVLLANTFATSRLKNMESATYLAVYQHMAEFRGTASGNRILMYPGGQTRQALASRLQQFYRQLTQLGVRVQDIFRGYQPNIASPDGAPLLTDDYAPVNILNHSD